MLVLRLIWPVKPKITLFYVPLHNSRVVLNQKGESGVYLHEKISREHFQGTFSLKLSMNFGTY